MVISKQMSSGVVLKGLVYGFQCRETVLNYLVHVAAIILINNNN